MPGGYEVATGSGTALMESWGALNVTLTDTNGQPLNLGPNQTATIRIPVSTRSATKPASIDLFYFNSDTGYWIQEGTATLSVDGTYYEGVVSHFTVWNADMIMDTVYVNGCVVDENNVRVSNVEIKSYGRDYSGSANAITDANGVFRLPIKKAGAALITGIQRNGSNVRLTNTVVEGPSESAIDATDRCLNLAQQSETFSIKLTWGAAPSDVDSHLYTPNGDHIYFDSEGYLTGQPFAQLDVDDTDGFGPEVITITRLMVGTYTYVLHNYSETFTPGMKQSPVRVELNRDGRTQVFSPSAEDGAYTWWTAFRVTVDARCNTTVEPVDAWDTTALTSSSITDPVYCQR